MLPLVMPWETRNASSVLTSTSKIALPTPRTSYFASAIHFDPSIVRQGGAAYHDPHVASKRATFNLRMIRSFLTVSSGTLASRLLGFLRDSMIAALLGTGPIADAFLVAFQLVNVARRLLSEGALNAALVPT